MNVQTRKMYPTSLQDKAMCPFGVPYVCVNAESTAPTHWTIRDSDVTPACRNQSHLTMSDIPRIWEMSPPLLLTSILPSEDQQSTSFPSFFATLARRSSSAPIIVRSSLIHTRCRSSVVVDACRSLPWELVSPRPQAPACKSGLRRGFG